MSQVRFAVRGGSLRIMHENSVRLVQPPFTPDMAAQEARQLQRNLVHQTMFSWDESVDHPELGDLPHDMDVRSFVEEVVTQFQAGRAQELFRHFGFSSQDCRMIAKIIAAEDPGMVDACMDQYVDEFTDTMNVTLGAVVASLAACRKVYLEEGKQS